MAEEGGTKLPEGKEPPEGIDPARLTAAGVILNDAAGVRGALTSRLHALPHGGGPVTLGMALMKAQQAENKGAENTTEVREPEGEKISRSGGGAGAAIAVLGIYNGTKEYFEDKEKGNVAGQVIDATDVGLGGLNLTIHTATALGREVAPYLEDGAKIGGTAVLVAQSVSKISHAEGTFVETDDKGNITGIGNKGEVTLKEGAKIGTGLGIASLAGTAGLTGIAAAAAPIALTGIAVYAVDKGGQAAIDANNAWKELDHEIDEESHKHQIPLGQGRVPISDDPNHPDIRHYAHILPQIKHASEYVRDQNIVGGPLAREKDGRIITSPANAKILSDPRNFPEIEQALEKQEQKDAGIMRANEQSTPVIFRWSDASMQKTQYYEIAKSQFEKAGAAREELSTYKHELAAYDEAHPQGVSPPAQPSPPTANPADIRAIQTELAKRGLYTGPVDGKWNASVNQGLNVLIYTAQKEGQTAGLYKDDIDLRYGHGTATVFAASIVAKTPEAVDRPFLEAMNRMYSSGSLQTLYQAETPEAVSVPRESITVAANIGGAGPQPVEMPLTTRLENIDTPAGRTPSYARDADKKGNPDFNAKPVKPAFTVATNGQSPQAPVPVAPVIVVQQTVKPSVPTA